MKRTTYVAQAGVIAAVYAVLTFFMIQTGLASGPIQFRLSEALTVVACVTPAAIPGLTLGSIVASRTAAGVRATALLDVIFGARTLGALGCALPQAPGLALLGRCDNALIVRVSAFISRRAATTSTRSSA